MKFIDHAPITLSSGRGGAGCVSFRREKYVPRGGPDGGSGGRGGHVIIRVDDRKHSLLDFKHKRSLSAGNGQPGSGQNKTGANGNDIVIFVPPGTVIKEKGGEILLDLGSDGEKLFLRGGRGGLGNVFYANSVRQAPHHAQQGETGETKELVLEVKLIADIGIIGFPNAGKSTLISRLSSAKPKIADYPFTTLTPNLGVVSYGDHQSFIVADIPGLVPGAHQGVGLGIKFLRHIERTKAFLHVIDASEFSGRDPLEDFEQINTELVEYDRTHKDALMGPLGNRKQVIALNKVDLLSAEQERALTAKFQKLGYEVLPISAVTGKGLDQVVTRLGKVVFGSDV
jgi:GTP-binding protein